MMKLKNEADVPIAVRCHRLSLLKIELAAKKMDRTCVRLIDPAEQLK